MVIYALRPAWVYGTATPAQLASPYSFAAGLGIGEGRGERRALTPLLLTAPCAPPLRPPSAALWLAHFVKREAETLWVHRFSRPTMPRGNLVKNCAYYWAFAGETWEGRGKRQPREELRLLLGLRG